MTTSLLFPPLKKGGRGGERVRLQTEGLRTRERLRVSEGRESRSDLLLIYALKSKSNIKSKSPSIPLFQRGRNSP